MQWFKKLHFTVQSIQVLMRNMYLSRQWMLPVEVNMWSQQSLRFEVCMCRRHVGMAKYAHQRHHGRVPGRAARGHLVRAEDESLQQRRLREPEHSVCNTGLRRQWVRDSSEGTVWLNCSVLLSVLVRKSHRLSCLACAGTIPPIKSPLEKNDDVKKLFSIGSPVILVTVGVALLFIIRKKRKEKRLKRLRGEERTWAEGRV